MIRPSRDWTYLEIAKIIAMRGSCLRMKVGCVITKNRRIIASGYNGPLESEPTCNKHCDHNQKCEHAIHAEQNAIAFAASDRGALFGATVYCTHGPCANCASLMVQAGIMKVVYIEPYRLPEGIMILRRANIETLCYNPDKDTNFE